MFTLVWLPSWDWCPPLLNLGVRRRLGPDVDGCSGVDIVSCGFLIVCSVSDGIVLCSWDVL
jgi:hypothetical protein